MISTRPGDGDRGEDKLLRAREVLRAQFREAVLDPADDGGLAD
jgi:hypothetical protein